MQKGISPLISTAILILMAVVLSAIVASWLSPLIKTTTSEVENKTKEKLQCEHASFFINSISYNCSGDCSANVNHTLKLNLKNNGGVKLSVLGIFIRNTTGYVFSFPPNETILGMGSKDFINISKTSCNGINRTVDEVIVTTNCVIDTFPGKDIVFQNC